jgi:hypothetical protein
VKPRRTLRGSVGRGQEAEQGIGLCAETSLRVEGQEIDWCQKGDDNRQFRNIRLGKPKLGTQGNTTQLITTQTYTTTVALCRTSTHDVEQQMQLCGVQERCAAFENSRHRARPPTRGCRQYLRYGQKTKTQTNMQMVLHDCISVHKPHLYSSCKHCTSTPHLREDRVITKRKRVASKK